MMSPLIRFTMQPKLVQELRLAVIDAIYHKYCSKIDDLSEWEFENPGEFAMHYGPAHLVWADRNYTKAQWCLDHWDEYDGDIPDKHLEIVRESLCELIRFLESHPEFAKTLSL